MTQVRLKHATSRLVALDHLVDKAEGSGLLARWEFGKALLDERVGKQLPAGRLNEVASATGKSRQEIGYRMMFAAMFPTRAELSNAIGKFGSWHEIVNVALAAERPPQQPTPPLPEGQFRVIYADPPWQFANSGFDQAAAAIYPTMSTDEICRLGVLNIHGDGVLFLWVPAAMVPDGLRVCKDWGFDYKTNLVWVKRRDPGIGWYTRSRHELLLWGVAGAAMFPQVKPVSWFECETTAHSHKPDLVYDIIEGAYDGPYCELFARRRRPGWTSWGHDVQQEVMGGESLHA